MYYDSLFSSRICLIHSTGKENMKLSRGFLLKNRENSSLMGQDTQKLEFRDFPVAKTERPRS